MIIAFWNHNHGCKHKLLPSNCAPLHNFWKTFCEKVLMSKLLSWNKEVCISRMKYGLTAFCKMSVIIGWVAIGILYWKIIQYLLNIINPSNTFRNKINVLLEEYPNIDIVAMGFPENWKEQPLWKSWMIKRVMLFCCCDIFCLARSRSFMDISVS